MNYKVEFFNETPRVRNEQIVAVSKVTNWRLRECRDISC